ncbi:hypothetical protein [uncultured Corynebacterium sp.]|nr:hypothetical protein [uncultured Corynebacterium sp.]
MCSIVAALPGPTWVKLVGMFFLLMEVAFPAIGPLMPWTDVGVR